MRGSALQFCGVALPVVTQARPDLISVDPDYLRPYTDEYTGGVDHELLPNLRLSIVGTHRVERNPQATSNPANPYDTFLTTRVDTGRDGVAGTADDGSFQFYNRTSTAANQTFFTNDRNFRQTYNGIEISAGNQNYQVFDGLLFWDGGQDTTDRGAPIDCQTAAAQSPISSPKIWLTSGAVTKSPSPPIGWRVA